MSTPEQPETPSSTPSTTDELLDDQLDQVAGGIGHFGFPTDGKP